MPPLPDCLFQQDLIVLEEEGVSIKTNQRELTGVFMRNPRGLLGHITAIKGIKGQATCGFKGHRRGSHHASFSIHKHTHILEQSIVCREVRNWGGSDHCPSALRSDVFMSH